MPASKLDDKSIFNAAREIHSEDARREYLQQACKDDLDQLDRVTALLRGFEKNSQFLESPAVGLLPTPAGSPTIERPGTQIGPYKIREQLGEGGMGVVYVAEQIEPVRRKVALKIIKPGMDSKEVLARFDAERQALAMMSHPNIAKILDGGTTDTARPYFVMELVRGIPITEFCDEQNLNMRQRLDLFVTLCRAVQHAHQKGIIHRDLKPSNVLVELHDVAPIPKVIDFGIAKATNQQLTQQTIYTQFSQWVGTPLYMSPEQAQLSGLDIDTRSDVYSLGVLLYELLTGVPPFDESTLHSAGLDEFRRIIREDEPQRPSYKVSTLDNELMSTISDRRQTRPRELSLSMQRELDWIVMRALEKDRNRRYESASALAADIQRYLDDQPVQACPPSMVYRLRKYAKRHKGMLATAALLAATMLAATGVSVMCAIQAEDEKDKAVVAQQLADERLTQSEQSFAQALQAVDQMLARVGDERLQDVPQMKTVQAELLQDALKFYETLLAQDPGNPTVRYQMAVAQGSLGKVLGLLNSDGETAFQAAVATLDGLVRQFPDESSYRFRLADAYNDLGWNLVWKTGGARIKESESAHRSAAELFKRLSAQQTNEPGPQWHLAHSYVSLARTHYAQDQLAEAEGFARRAIELFRDSDGDAGNIHAAAYLMLAQIQQKQELFEQADEAFVNAIRIRREFLHDAPPYAGEQHFLADMLFKHGTLLETLDRKEDAEPCYREAADIWKRLADSYPNTSTYGSFSHSAQRSLVQLLIDTGQTDAANQLLNDIKPHTAQEYARRAELYAQRKVWDKALADYDMAIEILSPNGDPQMYVRRGEVFVKMNHVDKAMADFREAFATAGHVPEKVRQLSAISRGLSQNGQYIDALAVAQLAVEHASAEYIVHVALCEANLGLQQYDEALADINQAIDHNQGGTAEGWWLFKRRAEAHFGLNQFEQALADLNTALEGHPDDLSTVRWIPAEDVANCSNAKFREGVRELSNRAVELNNGSPESLIAQAALLAGLGDFEQARDDLILVLGDPNPLYYPLYQSALLSLQLADSDRYEGSCEKMLGSFKDSDVSNETHFTAWTCALAPDAIEDYTVAIKLARHAVEKDPHKKQYLTGLGAVLMRSGQYEAAKTELEKALVASDSAGTTQGYVRYFLAMTEHHLAQPAEAARSLAQANGFAEQELNDADNPSRWNRKLTLELLRKEAEALLGKPADSPDDANSPDDPEPSPIPE